MASSTQHHHNHNQQQHQQGYATHDRLRVLTSDEARMALFLVECRQLMPVTRRPDDYEKTRITHGSVFVWLDGVKGETGLERWTDGRSWGPSKCRDDFLLYEEKAKNGERRLTKATYTARRNTLEGSGLLWHLIAYYYKDQTDDLIDMRLDDVFGLYANSMAPGYFVSNRKDKSRRPREIPAQVPVSSMSRYDELVAALKNVLPSTSFSASSSSSASVSANGQDEQQQAQPPNLNQPRAGRPPSSSSVYAFGPPPGLPAPAPAAAEKERRRKSTGRAFASSVSSSSALTVDEDTERAEDTHYHRSFGGGVERHARLSSSVRQHYPDVARYRPSSPYHPRATHDAYGYAAGGGGRSRAGTDSTVLHFPSSYSSSSSSSAASSYAGSSRSSQSPSPSMSDRKIRLTASSPSSSAATPATSGGVLSIVPLDCLHAAARRRGALKSGARGGRREDQDAYEEAMMGVVAMDVSNDGEDELVRTSAPRETFRQMDERQLSLLNRSLWRFS